MKIKIHSIDAIRAISILAVLLIHTTTKVLEYTHYDLITYWPTLLLNQTSRFAVPLFFLISGFLLELNYKEQLDYKSYIKKRFSRIFIPYTFWSLIYYFFIYKNNTGILNAFLTGDASYQLYFIPSICIFYLAFPLIHKFYKFIASWPVLILLTAVQIRLMEVDYFVKQFTYPDPIRICLLGYLVFILGMVAAKNKEEIFAFISKAKLLLIPTLIYLAYYIFLEGKNRYYLTYNIEAFYSQWRPDILLYTLVIGAILFYLFEKPRLQHKHTEKLSKLSYLVFFIHVIILENTWKYIGIPIFNLMSKNPFKILAFDISFFGSVTIISFFIAYLIHKVPHLSKITG